MKKIIPFLLLGVLMLSGFCTKDEVKKVKGIVVERVTGKPVANVHVYIVHGEEEAMTDSNGSFIIDSWQSFPLKITVEGIGFKRVVTVIEKENKKHTIAIDRK